MTLEQYSNRVCSQNGEDGVIEHLLNVIGEGSKTCVEFGFGNQANTLNLISNKLWRGYLFDSSPESYLSGSSRYWDRLDVTVKRETIEPNNINKVFSQAGVPEIIDVLSVDIDGVDLHVFKALKGYIIRLLVIEYNASFGPHQSITVPYSANFNRMHIHPEYHGASLMALTKVAKEKDLKLVGVDGCGINAFYVEKKAPAEAVAVDAAFKNHSKRAGTWVDQWKYLKQFEYEEV